VPALAPLRGPEAPLDVSALALLTRPPQPVASSARTIAKLAANPLNIFM